MQPYIWLQLRDESESLATQRYHVRRGTAPQTAQQAATQMRGLLSGVSGCAALIQSYVLAGVESATLAPLAGAITQRHAVFVFSTSAPNQYAILALPGVRDDMLESTGPMAGVAIDQTNPAIQSFVAEMTGGAYCNKWGYPLVQLEAAYLQVRDAIFIPDWR